MTRECAGDLAAATAVDAGLNIQPIQPARDTGRTRAGAVDGQRAGHDVSAVIDGRVAERAGDLAAATAVTTQVLIN